MEGSSEVGISESGGGGGGGRGRTGDCFVKVVSSSSISESGGVSPCLSEELRFSLEGGLTFLRGLSFVACDSFLAFKLTSLSSSTCARLGGGAGGDSEGPVGLYMVLELLSLLCRALNFSIPDMESIFSKESSLSVDRGVLGGGGVVDILQTLVN